MNKLYLNFICGLILFCMNINNSGYSFPAAKCCIKIEKDRKDVNAFIENLLLNNQYLSNYFFDTINKDRGHTQSRALSPWPMMNYNPQHTSQSHLEGPLHPNLIWEYEIPGNWTVNSPIVIGLDNNILFWSGSNTLFSVDVNGQKNWNGSYCEGGEIIVNSDTTIYTILPTGAVIKTNHLGEYLNSFQVSYNVTGMNYIPSLSSIIVSNEYLNINESRILNLSYDLAQNWSYSTHKMGKLSSPAITNNSSTIIFLTENKELFAVNPNGTLIWKVNIPFSNSNSIGYTSPTIDYDNNIYFVLSYVDNNLWFSTLFAYNISGQLIWSKEINGEFANWNIIILPKFRTES